MEVDIIYIATHSRCGQELRVSDYRIKSLEDLRSLIKGNIKPLSLYCGTCLESIPATHFEIIKTEGIRIKELVRRTPIEKLTFANL